MQSTSFGQNLGTLKKFSLEMSPLARGEYMDCPACHKYRGSPQDVANHIMGVFDPSHTDWLEAQGLSPLDLVGVRSKGNYKPLIELLNRIDSSKSG